MTASEKQERKRAYWNKYYREHRERRRAQQKAYYLRNCEWICAKAKEKRDKAKRDKEQAEAVKEALSQDEIIADVYDKEEIYPNCTVQILTNTITGKVSVGWWRNE